MENGDAVNKIFGYDSILNLEPNTIFDFCANNTFVQFRNYKIEVEKIYNAKIKDVRMLEEQKDQLEQLEREKKEEEERKQQKLKLREERKKQREAKR